MKVFSADYLRDVGVQLFTACGAPLEEAQIVADNLIEASLMGLESHGVTRYIHYTEHVLIGKIKPGSPIRIVKESPTTAIVDVGFNFGPVGAARMVDIVCQKAAAANIACVVSQNCHHVSRLGSYVQKIAEKKLIGLAWANSSKHGHFVVPFGGREGRLATNPIAYGIPRKEDHPIVMDMSTSMISEGKIRVLMYEGKPIPPGSVLDASGHETTDPNVFYGPPKGTILPFGSPMLGYKGYGLGLLVEIMGGILGGNSTPVDLLYINGLCLMAINPEAFCGSNNFEGLIDDMSRYMTTTPPGAGAKEVVMPGELDFRIRAKRLAEGIPLSEETWHLIVEAAQKVGVHLPEEGPTG
jgi:LDH2 family malate/lactate/ureidoglycolate dehydrogenase